MNCYTVDSSRTDVRMNRLVGGVRICKKRGGRQILWCSADASRFNWVIWVALVLGDHAAGQEDHWILTADGWLDRKFGKATDLRCQSRHLKNCQNAGIYIAVTSWNRLYPIYRRWSFGCTGNAVQTVKYKKPRWEWKQALIKFDDILSSAFTGVSAWKKRSFDVNPKIPKFHQVFVFSTWNCAWKML